MRQLNVLVACEESGAVRDEFRRLGHNAWSCDLQPCDPASPFAQYHVQGDAVAVATEPWRFAQIPTVMPMQPWWDLMIAHPPCTYLCNSGVRWLFRSPSSHINLTRSAKIRVATTSGNVLRTHTFSRYANVGRVAALNCAAAFFNRLLSADIPHIAVENPIMHSYGKAMCRCEDPTQIIQPWMFGHTETKATCLWLRGLPKLEPNSTWKMDKAATMQLPKKMRSRIHYASPGPQRAKLRSKTYSGIALAMAYQWSEYIQNL